MLVGRPLPIQVPTAFLRIRPPDVPLCGDVRTKRSRRCSPATAKRCS